MVESQRKQKKVEKRGLPVPPRGTADYGRGVWTDKTTGQVIGRSDQEDSAILPYTKANKRRPSKAGSLVNKPPIWAPYLDLDNRPTYKPPKVMMQEALLRYLTGGG
jgi:hypothetical protein